MTTLSNKAAEIVAQARAAASKVDGWRPELASILCDAEREIRGLELSEGDYSSAEIEFLQSLLDRYSEDGGIIPLADDHAAFMRIVRKNLPALHPTPSNKVVNTQELAAIVHGAMVDAGKWSGGDPKPWQGGNSVAEDRARAAAKEIAALSLPSDKTVSAATIAVGRCIEGEQFDPFADPEATDFAERIARAALDSHLGEMK